MQSDFDDGEDEWMELLHPFILFLSELLKRFDSDFLEEISELHPQLMRMKDLTKVEAANTREQRRFAHDFGELARH